MTLILRDDVRFRVVGDEAVGIRQEAAEVLVLNAVGARILELVGEGHDAGRIVSGLEGEFEVATAELAADVANFLDELVQSGLLMNGGEG